MAANPIPHQSEFVEVEILEDESGQFLRLPEAFRLDATKVLLHRATNRRILVEPLSEKRRKWTHEEVQALADQFDAHNREFGPFMAEGRNQPPMQERDWPE
ncbi:antitoxin [Granulicella tundricola]|uniref:SpoVT/AbrB domain-containing protein n=1 Tax=Granulicella tundricola (strain ATCC BAA-1859 / DSM 23138 / MP5ACTX9) TaxID=1198114 RepID=E8X3B0_GRATM|nr:hypothetical protein [Granulicella tundricola]ADW70411.1 hypothetical protein AciX9_3405 [Granulicella tundricola MP5ACTX9]